MWVDERNRRSYKMSEEIWKLAYNEMNEKYKDSVEPKEYKEIESIAEVKLKLMF